MTLCRALGAGLLGVGCLVAVPNPAASQIRGPEVTSVEFVGNATFPRDSLQRAIATSETECRSFWLQWVLPVCPFFGWGQRRAELRDRDVTLDVQRLIRWYQLRGFREVDVTSATDVRVAGAEGGERVIWSTSGRPPVHEPIPEDAAEVATVRFTIQEGRPIIADSIGYVTPEGLDAGELLDGLPIRPGDRWNTLELDATRDTLIRRLRNEGYPYADVLRQTRLPSEEPYHADVTFEVEPGVSARYGPIRVEGTDRLDESTVLRTLPFRSGDPYRLDQLFEGQARLFALQIVRNARVAPDTATMEAQSVPDSIVPLFVQITEGDPYRFRGGVGFNTAECINTEARWTSRNFFGGGRVLQPRARLANITAPCGSDSGQGQFADLTWLAAIDFSQPWIFSTRNRFNASIFAERQSVPDIFIRRAYGLDLS
ncbi:MAG: POTRA domain-containing protein, partial [Gemmatimonadota bacterium]